MSDLTGVRARPGGLAHPAYGAALALAVILCLQSLVATPEAVAAAGPAKPYDFNGDGYADLAIGVPGERVRGKDGAGAVNVLYGSTKGLTAKRAQLWSQASRGVRGKPTANEGFGSELTSGDFDCDGRADLAVASGATLAVLYGGRKGLTSRDQLLGSGFRDDPIGHLTTGDFNRDGCLELAVESYGRTAVFRGSRRGLGAGVRLAVPVAVTGQGTDLGGIVAGDLTGDGIDDLVAYGAHRTTPDGDVGGVAVIPGSSGGLQPSRAHRFGPDDANIKAPTRPFFSYRFGEAMTIGDFNGDRHLDLAVGDAYAGDETSYDELTGEPVSCPGSDFCSGAVVVLFGTGSGLSSSLNQVLTKSTLHREHQSGFPTALAAGDVNGDGRDELAVHQLWSITVLRGTATGLDVAGLQEWNWGSPGVKGREADDVFGSFGCGSVRLLDHGRGRGVDLSVGSQHYKDMTGAVNVLYGSSAGLTATGDQLWRQSSRGVPGSPRDEDFFGGNSTCYVDEG